MVVMGGAVQYWGLSVCVQLPSLVSLPSPLNAAARGYPGGDGAPLDSQGHWWLNVGLERGSPLSLVNP